MYLPVTLFRPLTRKVDGKEPPHNRYPEEFDSMGDAGISGKEDKDEEQYTQQHGIAEHLLDRDQRGLPLQLADVGCKGHLPREGIHGIERASQGVVVRLHRHLEDPCHQSRGDGTAYALAHESHGTKGLEEMLEGDNLRQIGSEYGIDHHVARIFQEEGQIEPLDIHVGRNQKIHEHLIGDHQHKADKGGRLCFYDKNREQKSHREPIPELYEGRNVLRYEQRYTNRIASQFKVSEVTGAMLYDEAFYIGLLNRWKDAYKAIQKINDVSLNFQAMKKKQQLYKMGVLSLIEQAGGQLQMIEQINEAQKRGELSKKQAFDLRQVINEVCKIRDGLTVPNEAIKELDKKVSEAVKYYR